MAKAGTREMFVPVYRRAVGVVWESRCGRKAWVRATWEVKFMVSSALKEDRETEEGLVKLWWPWTPAFRKMASMVGWDFNVLYGLVVFAL
jgi:hypothetical protein